MPKPKSKSLVYAPMDDLHRQLTQQAVGAPRKSHFGPQDVVDPLKIEAVDPMQKWQERQLPSSESPLAQRGLLDALVGNRNEPSYSNPLADPNAMADFGGMAGTMEKLGKKALPSLPIIAPEAYEHVKAGGLRLYSRLTDAFAKAPKQMAPDKIRSIAKSGASAEEINFRKLEEFLKGRQPMDKVNREDVMKHLESNPIELDVVRKGGKGSKVAEFEPDEIRNLENEYNNLVHEFDTRYGGTWATEQASAVGTGRPVLTPEESQRYIDLERRLDEARTADNNNPHDYQRGDNSRTHWESLQTPGPKENYGETLINFPLKSSKVTPQEGAHKLGLGDWNTLDAAQQEYVLEQIGYQADMAAGEAAYSSPHWDEPNNIVHSRHNERRLNPDSVELNHNKLGTIGNDASAYDAHGGSKGHYTEEVQGDWPQAGREHGFRTPDVEAEYAAEQAKRELLNKQMSEINQWPETSNPDNSFNTATSKIAETNPYDEDVRGTGYSNMKELLDDYERTPQKFQGILTDDEHAILAKYLGLRKEENASFRKYVMDNPISLRAPDMPAYKDTYPELALKADLLDWANDPQSEWYGIADAHTNAAMEQHGYTRAGTQIGYDEKHPKTLKDVLTPYGGRVEHVETPWPQALGQNEAPQYDDYSIAQYTGKNKDSKVPTGSARVVDFTTNPGQGTHVMDIPPPPGAGATGIGPARSESHANNARAAMNDLKNSRARLGGPPNNAFEDVERYMPSNFDNRAGVAPKSLANPAAMWKATADPAIEGHTTKEMKRLIAERGFSAMALLAALQRANTFGSDAK